MNQFEFNEQCWHLLHIEELCVELFSPGSNKVYNLCKTDLRWMLREALIPAYCPTVT